MEFLKSNGTIRNGNVVSFGIRLPRCGVISRALPKQNKEGLLEFTSAGIVNPIRDGGERSTRLAVFKGKKVCRITGESKFRSQKVNHFVTRFGGVMKYNEAVQGVDANVVEKILNFDREEFIDFFLIIMEVRGVKPGIRSV